MAFAPALVRVVADGGVFLMAVTGVHRRVPVGDEVLGQRGVEFGLGTVHPLPELFRAHLFGQTWQGVMAFQKLHGLKRSGKFDEATQRELAVSGVPGGLIPNGGLPRVEVDISRQILMYFDAFGLNRIVAVSSGSNKKYCEISKKTGKQNCGDARTPRGNYRIERRIKGKRESDLGILYSPLYFTGGFAIHGSPSIPAYAASHGCVRITNRTADWMFEDIKNGTPVYVFD